MTDYSPIIIEPEPGRKYDAAFESLMKGVRKRQSKGDDYLLFISGDTGSGKSTLATHALEIVYGPDFDIDQMALSTEEFARALKTAKETDKKYIVYDEAFVNRRRWNSDTNNSLIELYFKIRAMSIFHIWCNPSVEIIDKVFTKERIKALIYVYPSAPNVWPKRYAFIPKDNIIQIITEHKSLEQAVLHKYAHRYARYIGYFAQMSAPIWAKYCKKKDSAVDFAADEFISKFGANDFKYRKSHIAREAGVHARTIEAWFINLQKKGLIEENKHFIHNANGFALFNKEGLSVLLQNAPKRGVLKEAG